MRSQLQLDARAVSMTHTGTWQPTQAGRGGVVGVLVCHTRSDFASVCACTSSGRGPRRAAASGTTRPARQSMQLWCDTGMRSDVVAVRRRHDWGGKRSPCSTGRCVHRVLVHARTQAPPLALLCRRGRHARLNAAAELQHTLGALVVVVLTRSETCCCRLD